MSRGRRQGAGGAESLQVRPRQAVTEWEAGVEIRSDSFQPSHPWVRGSVSVPAEIPCPAAVRNRLACRAEHRGPPVWSHRGADPWELASASRRASRAHPREQPLSTDRAFLRVLRFLSRVLVLPVPLCCFLLVTSRDQPPTPNRQAFTCTPVFTSYLPSIPGSRKSIPGQPPLARKLKTPHRNVTEEKSGHGLPQIEHPSVSGWSRRLLLPMIYPRGRRKCSLLASLHCVVRSVVLILGTQRDPWGSQPSFRGGVGVHRCLLWQRDSVLRYEPESPWSTPSRNPQGADHGLRGLGHGRA